MGCWGVPTAAEHALHAARVNGCLCVRLCRWAVPAMVESALGDTDTDTCEGDRVSRLVLGTRACGGCCSHGAPLAPRVLVLLWVSLRVLSPHRRCRGCCQHGAALLSLVPRVPGSAHGRCQCPGVECPEGAGNLLVGGPGRYWVSAGVGTGVPYLDGCWAPAGTGSWYWCWFGVRGAGSWLSAGWGVHGFLGWGCLHSGVLLCQHPCGLGAGQFCHGARCHHKRWCQHRCCGQGLPVRGCWGVGVAGVPRPRVGVFAAAGGPCPVGVGVWVTAGAALGVSGCAGWVSGANVTAGVGVRVTVSARCRVPAPGRCTCHRASAPLISVSR